MLLISKITSTKSCIIQKKADMKNTQKGVDAEAIVRANLAAGKVKNLKYAAEAGYEGFDFSTGKSFAMVRVIDEGVDTYTFSANTAETLAREFTRSKKKGIDNFLVKVAPDGKKSVYYLRSKGVLNNLKISEMKLVDGIATDVKKIPIKKPSMVKKKVIKVKPSADADFKPRGIGWGEKHWKKWVQGLTKTERAALRGYSGNDYVDISKHLRTGKSVGNLKLDQIKNIDKAIKKAVTPDDVVVYRGIKAKRFSYFKKAKNKVIVDKGFVSTTLDREKAYSFTDLFGTKQAYCRIKVPKGTNAGYLGTSPFLHPREAELLLSRGTKFKVTGIWPGVRPPGFYGAVPDIIDMEVVK